MCSGRRVSVAPRLSSAAPEHAPRRGRPFGRVTVRSAPGEAWAPAAADAQAGGLPLCRRSERDYYNTRRPHRAVGRRTPAAAFEARARAAPSLPGFVVPSHYRVRQDRIDSCGKTTLRYRSRLHDIGLGRRYAGARVLVLMADLGVRVLTKDGELLRELTLDPDRNYQPQG